MRSYNSRHMYHLPDLFSMGWGKVRRVFLLAFRKKRVIAKLDRRRGACTRCGACCKILFKCPAYDESDGIPSASSTTIVQAFAVSSRSMRKTCETGTS